MNGLKSAHVKKMLGVLFIIYSTIIYSDIHAQSSKAPDPMAKPALLIVDMQNDFVREGAPMEVPDARKTIPQLQQLITYCRKAGIPVIYTRFLSTNDSILLWKWSPKIAPPIMACRPKHKRYYPDIKDSLYCAEIINELRPAQGEVIIDKFGYGAFHNTKLDSILHSMGVESIFLTGTVTQICVEESGREAFHYGYKTTLISDGVSSFMPDLHAAAIKNFGMKFGWVMNTSQVIGELSKRYGRK